MSQFARFLGGQWPHFGSLAVPAIDNMAQILTEREAQVRMGLKEMRRQRLKLHLLLAAEAVAIALLAGLLQGLGPLLHALVSVVLALLLASLSVWTFGRARALPCPACHKPFCFRSGKSFYYFNDFALSCVNCGLKLNCSNICAVLESGVLGEE
jgi:hypothetical protein